MYPTPENFMQDKDKKLNLKRPLQKHRRRPSGLVARKPAAEPMVPGSNPVKHGCQITRPWPHQ